MDLKKQKPGENSVRNKKEQARLLAQFLPFLILISFFLSVGAASIDKIH